MFPIPAEILWTIRGNKNLSIIWKQDKMDTLTINNVVSLKKRTSYFLFC